MKKIIRICFVMFIIASTASSAFAETINLPAEQAYEKVLNYLLDLGAIPATRDKELLIIKTDPLPSKLTEKECDCGSMFFIPYMKDKRTKTAATYQIRIKKIDDKTSDIDVKITIDGYLDVTENAPFFIDKHRETDEKLNCKSTGILEQNLIAAIKK